MQWNYSSLLLSLHIALLFDLAPLLSRQVWTESTASPRRWRSGWAVWVLGGLQLWRCQHRAASKMPQADLPSPQWSGGSAYGQHGAGQGCRDIQTHWRCWGELRCTFCAPLVALHLATEPPSIPDLLQTKGRMRLVFTAPLCHFSCLPTLDIKRTHFQFCTNKWHCNKEI